MRLSCVLCLTCLLPASAAFGHHSVAAYFDMSRVIKVQGKLTEVKWRNPHFGFTLNVRNEAGEEAAWDVSGT